MLKILLTFLMARYNLTVNNMTKDSTTASHTITHTAPAPTKLEDWFELVYCR